MCSLRASVAAMLLSVASLLGLVGNVEPGSPEQAKPQDSARPDQQVVGKPAAPPALRPPARQAPRAALRPEAAASRSAIIEAAVAHPCQGLAITQVFPASIVAGQSFLVTGCGFGKRPVALVDAAAGLRLDIDFWSENVIQARHPGGHPTAQLRVVAATGAATEPVAVAVAGVAAASAPCVEAGPVDVLAGAGFFHWSPIDADEYAVECRALGEAVPPRSGVFTEVARLPAGPSPARFGWIASHCPSDHVCWQPEPTAWTATIGAPRWFACRVLAVKGGAVSATSNYVVGKSSASRDDNFFAVGERCSWPHLLEGEP